MITALVLATAFALPPQQSDAVIGVTAIHLESGRRISVRGREPFPMGSVYKYPIGVEVLHQVDAGKLKLDQKVTVMPRQFGPSWSPLRDEANGKPITRTIGELLQLMVDVSDNTACDVLIEVVGGPKVVTRRMSSLGAKGVRIDRTEKQISLDIKKSGEDAYTRDVRDTATPDAMAALLANLWQRHHGLKKESHALLMKHLINSPTGERKLRAAAPKGWQVAHKSGMMPQTSNDVGILTSPDGKNHVVIAIFATRSKSEYKVIDADVAAVTRAVLAHFDLD